jgi:phage terminase small subunit
MIIAAREYLKGRSKSDALRLAGYSESLAATRPQHVFNNPRFQAELARRQAEYEKRHMVTVEYLREKMMEVIEADGVKDADKLRALELLGRNLGMFKDQLEITMKEDLVERLQRGRDRVRAEAQDAEGVEDV